MLQLLFLLLNQSWAGENADINVLIKGMVCSFCVQGIEKKFSAEESIQTVNVDLDTSTVSLWLKETKTLSDDRIQTVVKSAGYNVQEIKRKKDTPPKP